MLMLPPVNERPLASERFLQSAAPMLGAHRAFAALSEAAARA